MKQRAVVILGAGAARAWDALLTNELTGLLLKDKSFLTKTGQPLAEFVFKKLKVFHNGYENGINFETIINTLESILNYYMNKTVIGGSANFVSSNSKWFEENSLVKEMMNLKFVAGSYVNDHGTVINLANNDTYINIHPSRAEVAYINSALKHYLEIIRNKIAAYAHNANTERYIELNSATKELFSYLVDKDFLPRVYTTNYDRLLPSLFHGEEKLDFFDGFDILGGEQFGNKIYKANIPRILTDKSCSTYYCLHGSIFWDYKFTGTDLRYQFFCTPNFSHTTNFYNNAEYTNPGDNTLIYNIVTGYNKLQKISIEPLNSFHSIFAQDCIIADIIITVGYSFSDFHINRPITNAFRFNAAKLLHISFGGNTYSALQEFNNLKTNILRPKNEFKADTYVVNDWLKSDTGNQMVYCNGFKSFLLNKEWLNSNI